MCARHITLETYFNVKTLERIPWELVRETWARVGFPKGEEKRFSRFSVYRAICEGGGTRAIRGIGDIKGETHDSLLFFFNVEKFKTCCY